jgi:hypothetical protein
VGVVPKVFLEVYDNSYLVKEFSYGLRINPTVIWITGTRVTHRAYVSTMFITGNTHGTGGCDTELAAVFVGVDDLADTG